MCYLIFPNLLQQTFQRIRNNRQNRLRIKVRKRKYGDMYFMENMFCNSCPICKRKYAMETGKIPPDEDNVKQQDEIETVDVESCNDDVPDSNSENQQQVHHAHMPALSGSSSHSSSHSSSNGMSGGGANLHNSNSQPGKLDGILYRTTCVINKESGNVTGEDDVSTNVATTSSSTSSNSSSSGGNWGEAHGGNNNHVGGTQGHISGTTGKHFLCK